MSEFFRNCDPYIVEAASITTRDDSRVCLLDTVPQNAVKRPSDFQITEKDLIERPYGSEKMSIYHSLKVPLDHEGVPIIGIPKSAQALFVEKYLGAFPEELKNPEVYTGILMSDRPLYGTDHTLCTATPMGSDCIVLLYERTTKKITPKGTWGKIIHDRHLTFVIFPITLIPRVSVETSDFCFSKGEFNHDLPCEFNEIFHNTFVMENYLYLKTLQDQHEATYKKIEKALKEGESALPITFGHIGIPPED